MQKKPEKSTSDRLLELLRQLSKDQIRFIVACQDYPNKKYAAKAVGIKSNTVYKWPDIVNEAAQLMAIEMAGSAAAIRKRNLVKAMMVKVAGLDSSDESIRQKAATEIIEGVLGKAGQNLDITTKGEKIGTIDEERYDRAVSTLADAVREGLSGKGTEPDGEVDTAE